MSRSQESGVRSQESAGKDGLASQTILNSDSCLLNTLIRLLNTLGLSLGHADFSLNRHAGNDRLTGSVNVDLHGNGLAYLGIVA